MQSDSCVAQNEDGGGTADGSCTLSTEHAGAGSSVGPKGNTSTGVSHSTDIKGCESHHEKNLWCQMQQC